MELFDLHCDTPYECYVNQKPFLDKTLAVNADCGKDFSIWKQTFAVWIKDDLKNPFWEYKKMLEVEKAAVNIL